MKKKGYNPKAAFICLIHFGPGWRRCSYMHGTFRLLRWMIRVWTITPVPGWPNAIINDTPRKSFTCFVNDFLWDLWLKKTSSQNTATRSHLRRPAAADQSSPCHLILSIDIFQSACLRPFAGGRFIIRYKTHSHFIHKPVPSPTWHSPGEPCPSLPIITFNPSPLPRHYLIIILKHYSPIRMHTSRDQDTASKCPEAHGKHWAGQFDRHDDDDDLWQVKQGNAF